MKHLIMSILAALGLGTGSCAQNEHITSVDAAQFEAAISADSVQLIDVRTAGEYAEGHIANAVNIDVKLPDFASKAAGTLDKDRPAYVYCRSGQRSMKAARMLAKQGFEVVNLNGGIMEWMNAGKPVNQ
ncbi:rhodanese-like domain-containing protein [Hallella bergensis]|uniref:rhodanese-like domain-containing protein n=1 Tax=Hallella bergensis TaxID=242750 RepID=UPI0023F2DFC4|nr:rhodanese-like domain-containing protein [Hallella bergensis]